MTAKKTPVVLTCQHCAASFSVQPWAAAQKYCSKTCYDAARRENMSHFYLRTRVNGRHVLVHRHVMELKLGRALLAGEVVHHINGDKLDNRPENLELMPLSDHCRLEASGRAPSEETRRKMSAAHKGKKHPNRKPAPPESNLRRSEVMKRIRREHPELWANRWPKR